MENKTSTGKEILKKLKEVGKELKISLRTKDDLTSALETGYKEEKITAKEQIILQHPLPNSVIELLMLTRFIYSIILKKRNSDDELIYAWKEKLEQVYIYAERNFGDTEEFKKIKECCSKIKKREKREMQKIFAGFAFFMLTICLVLSIVYKSSVGLFFSINAIFSIFILLLYACNSLDGMINYVKECNRRQKRVPIFVQIIAWCLFVPFIAGLIVSICYLKIVFIIILVVLSFIDMVFLIYIYEN